MNPCVSPAISHSEFHPSFFSPSRSFAFNHFLSETSRGDLLPFDDFRTIVFSSQSGNRPHSLFTVFNSSPLKSVSPTSSFLPICSLFLTSDPKQYHIRYSILVLSTFFNLHLILSSPHNLPHPTQFFLSLRSPSYHYHYQYHHINY